MATHQQRCDRIPCGVDLIERRDERDAASKIEDEVRAEPPLPFVRPTARRPAKSAWG
jgi:hypothetical protein